MHEILQYITESEDEHGYQWRYLHPPKSNHETLELAMSFARQVATGAAHDYGISYVVGTTPRPAAVHVLPLNHPMVLKESVKLMYEMTPEGKRIQPQTSRPGSKLKSSPRCSSRLCVGRA
jgi:hypothetical protein